jgi:hypothetical protein
MKVYNPINGRLDALTERSGFKPVINRPERDRLSALKDRLNQLFQWVLNTAAGSAEPQITQKRDRAGNLYFKVYDPSSGESMSFGSEREIRTWIEQRYHHY